MTAVVVNWNCADLLERCLTSLRDNAPQGGAMEVIVVDNGSTDRSVEMVRQDWPEVRLLTNDHNAGFPRANNQAIRTSDAEYLLLVNSDAFVGPHCIDRMLAAMQEGARVAVVGPRLVYGDGRWQRWTAGREPSLAAALNHHLFLDRILPTRLFRGIWLSRDVRTPFQPDWVVSACMLVRHAALDEVGLLDESFASYVEDLDLCRRVRAAGWSVWYEPAAEAVHLMGQSSQRQTGSASPAALRNFNLYFERLHGKGQARCLRAIETVGFGLRAAGYLLARGVGRGRPGMARQHWNHVKLSLRNPAAAGRGL